MDGLRNSWNSARFGSEENGSLNGYSNFDAGKFNEEGSFIGQYVPKQIKLKSAPVYRDDEQNSTRDPGYSTMEDRLNEGLSAANIAEPLTYDGVVYEPARQNYDNTNAGYVEPGSPVAPYNRDDEQNFAGQLRDQPAQNNGRYAHSPGAPHNPGSPDLVDSRNTQGVDNLNRSYPLDDQEFRVAGPPVPARPNRRPRSQSPAQHYDPRLVAADRQFAAAGYNHQFVEDDQRYNAAAVPHDARYGYDGNMQVGPNDRNLNQGGMDYIEDERHDRMQQDLDEREYGNNEHDHSYYSDLGGESAV